MSESKREIKFRIWKPKERKYHLWSPGCVADLVDWDASQSATDDANGCVDVIPCDTSGWVWDQYTGQKDRHSREIYENDILSFEPDEDLRRKWWVEGDGRGDLAVVEWMQSGARWIGCIQSQYGGEGYEELTARNYRDRWTVLGNIHEHAHLLAPPNSGEATPEVSPKE